jgi:hypothetical protein
MELDYLEATLAEFLDTDSAPMIQLAKLNFFGLATIINKSPMGIQGLFSGDPSDSDIAALIELQINVILTSLKALSANLEK